MDSWIYRGAGWCWSRGADKTVGAAAVPGYGTACGDPTEGAALNFAASL